MSQLTMSQDPAVGIPGMLADNGPNNIISRILMTAGLAAGFLAKKVIGSADDKAQPIAAAAATVLNDPDTFKTNIASTAGIQTFTGADFQGAVGDDPFWPPVNAVLVLNSHADWDATTAVVTGYDENGRWQTENLSIPNGGNATVTGTLFWTQILSLVIPAQADVNGTATFGTGTRIGPLTAHCIAGMAVYSAAREPQQYQIAELVPLLTQGRIYATAEEAVADGDAVYVRLVAAGAEVVGALRKSPDGTPGTAPDAALLVGARWRSTASAAGIAVVEFDLAA